MSETFSFRPVWKRGLILHTLLALLLAGCGGALLLLAFQQRLGGLLILYLFGTLVLLGLLALVIYRAYALTHASYTLEREGLRIRWGLRREDIPLAETEWVRPASDLVTPLGRPPYAMPGALLGKIEHQDLGNVEFIASDYHSLILIETVNHVFAISPEDKVRFLETYQRTLELGSITPIDAYTAKPAQFIQTVFSDLYSRITLIASTLLTLMLVVITSLVIPYLITVSMGIDAAGRPLAPVSANSLLIFPLLEAGAWAADVILGLYLLHETGQRRVPYLLWTAAMLTPFLLLIALLIILL